MQNQKLYRLTGAFFWISWIFKEKIAKNNKIADPQVEFPEVPSPATVHQSGWNFIFKHLSTFVID